MYPFNTLDTATDIRPLFGDQLRGTPYIFDFSSKNPATAAYDTTKFPAFQQAVFDELDASGSHWGIGLYLQERRSVLRQYPQMMREGRIYHVGLDIAVPEGFALFAPLRGTVFAAGKEEGIGNFGGFVVLHHDDADAPFYSLYGHLNADHLVREGERVDAGQLFGRIGGGSDSGGWFTHTHLQIVTEEARRAGRMFQGYVAEGDLPLIESLFPSPYPLFRY